MSEGTSGRPALKTFVSYEDLISPPLSEMARRRIGFLLRRLQQGHELREPIAKKLRSKPRLFELRVPDGSTSWRLIYYTGEEEIVVLKVFRKKTRRTPAHELATCQERLGRYFAAKG